MKNELDLFIISENYMEIKDGIFKAYDIRGVYPEEVNEEVAYRLGRAFARMIFEETKKTEIKIVVSRDMRLSSPELSESLIKGLTDQGANVVDIGLASTPTFYFGVAKFGYDAGVQVSASHNPKQFNGFKMVRQNAIPVSGETGIMDLRDQVVENNFKEVAKKGTVEKLDNVLDEHVAFSLNYNGQEKIKPLKVVVDAANSMGGPMIEKLFEKLPCELVKLNFELDGTFPAHEADPLKDENNKQLQEKVKEEKADIGIALDGDADRIFFIDNEGKTVEPAIIRGILAQVFLRKNPGAKICYDIRPGKITIDMIKEAGGEPVVTRVGHSLIKEKAREVDAVFAGESSGHFFLKMPFGMFEEPLTMILKILEELSTAGKSFAEFIKPLMRYFHSGEINFEVADKQVVFDKLKAKYGANLQYDFDGLSFEWPDWWFNVRGSNTENKVRLNLEATTEEIMKEKREEVSTLIKIN
jgi:phosphomannomutase